MLYKGITKYISNYFWRVFHSNGWSIKFNDNFSNQGEVYESLYEITLLEEYKVTITAHVITDNYQLSINGEYGVMWLNAKHEYNDEDGYSWHELNEMQTAIIDAEDNLLKIGIPFEKNYEFHGKNKANKKRRNDALIRKLNITEKNQKDWEKYKESMKKCEERKKKRQAESEDKNE